MSLNPFRRQHHHHYPSSLFSNSAMNGSGSTDNSNSNSNATTNNDPLLPLLVEQQQQQEEEERILLLQQQQPNSKDNNDEDEMMDEIDLKDTLSGNNNSVHQQQQEQHQQQQEQHLDCTFNSNTNTNVNTTTTASNKEQDDNSLWTIRIKSSRDVTIQIRPTDTVGMMKQVVVQALIAAVKASANEDDNKNNNNNNNTAHLLHLYANNPYVRLIVAGRLLAPDTAVLRPDETNAGTSTTALQQKQSSSWSSLLYSGCTVHAVVAPPTRIGAQAAAAGVALWEGPRHQQRRALRGTGIHPHNGAAGDGDEGIDYRPHSRGRRRRFRNHRSLAFQTIGLRSNNNNNQDSNNNDNDNNNNEDHSDNEEENDEDDDVQHDDSEDDDDDDHDMYSRYYPSLRDATAATSTASASELEEGRASTVAPAASLSRTSAGTASRASSQQQQQQSSSSSSSSLPLRRMGFDRLRETAGLRRSEIAAVRAYFSRSVERWIRQHPAAAEQAAGSETDLVRRRLLQEEAWMRAQGPASEFRLNLSSAALINNNSGWGRATNNNNNMTATEAMWRSGGMSATLGTDRDFCWGFILGFFVGFIMLIWVWMPTVTHKQKLGILTGISFQLALGMIHDSTDNIDDVLVD